MYLCSLPGNTPRDAIHPGSHPPNLQRGFSSSAPNYRERLSSLSPAELTVLRGSVSNLPATSQDYAKEEEEKEKEKENLSQ